jgi:hypothetical protein
MIEAEEQIYDCILEEGFSSNARKLIKKNISSLSNEFLTDILVENVNLYTSYLLLVDYLPHVWTDSNSSSNLLNYLNGLAHRLFYFAREYPLGKDIPKVQREELDEVHTKLCDFMKSCLHEELVLPPTKISETSAISDLVNSLSQYPKYSQEIMEIFQILASLFYRFALNEKQILKDQDELGVFITRCLVFWKLGVMDDEKMIKCFEEADEKYSASIQQEKFENILALEIQSYQFLQLGINREQVKLIAELFYKLKE